MAVVRRAVIDNEAIAVDELMAVLSAKGYPDASKGIIQGLRSDALAFLRLLREMGRLDEVEKEPEVLAGGAQAGAVEAPPLGFAQRTHADAKFSK
jgi:hypothetical protein